ncbi:hypothetical protein OIO90_006125 [Microbotryomycetes sp. JL221]|nr:hypothetical protein OIO90_006125 [Microbotryomycetes sp. JL221]
MTRLPPELVLYIFELATTVGSSSTSADAFNTSRLDTLFRLSLLSRMTHNWANERLYCRVSLTKPSTAHSLVKTLRHSPWLARKVLSLELDGSVSSADHSGNNTTRRTMTSRLDSLLALCNNLIHVHVKHAAVFALTDFSNGNNLKTLELTDVVLSDRTTTNRYNPFFVTLPRLSHLTLRQTFFDRATANHFNCPTTLPQLNLLEMDGCWLIEDVNKLRIVSSFEPSLLTNQLQLLILTGHTVQGQTLTRQMWDTVKTRMNEFVASCNKLRALSVSIDMLTMDFVNSLPASIELLHVKKSTTRPDQVQHTGLCEFDNDIQGVRALETSLMSLPLTDSPNGTSYFQLSCSNSTSRSTWFDSTPFGSSSSNNSSAPGTPHEWLMSSLPCTPTHERDDMASTKPLSQMTTLIVPMSWRRGDSTNSPTKHDQDEPESRRAEFNWYLQRLDRACDAREIRLEWQ